MEHLLIVTEVTFGLVLYDNFDDPIYFGWETKTKEEQMEILQSRRPKTYFDAYGKMSEDYYRKVYNISSTEPIELGTVRTVVIKSKVSNAVSIIDYNKNNDPVVQ